jgi:8-oxo-dGTP pyrophosphatase MutT (NUDIX family)
MNRKPEEWKVVESREIADCRVFKVREDLSESQGKRAAFFVVENPDWVNVVALTADHRVVLIEQFRHGAGQVTVEIPGGMIDNLEDPETAARRELLEETGYTSGNWVYLGTSWPNPAIQSNVIHHYLAVNAERTADVMFDEHESVATRLAHINEIPDLIRNGTIRHSLVVAAFQYFSFRWLTSI